MFYVPFSIAMIDQSEKNIYYYYTCIIYFVLITRILYVLLLSFEILCMLFMFYVSLLYTCLSENSSDELMLSNSHVNRR